MKRAMYVSIDPLFVDVSNYIQLVGKFFHNHIAKRCRSLN
jgi:hypothetical protein